MSVTRPLTSEAWIGLGLLGVAGLVLPWTRRIPILPALLAVPGALLIVRSGSPGPPWRDALVVGGVSLAAPLLAWLDQNAIGSPVPTLLIALTAVGVWATVPDTEEVLVLLGAMAIPTLLAWPAGLTRLGSNGAYALVGLLLWVISWGGRAREGAIIGAVAALGMILVAPPSARIARRLTTTVAGWAGIWLLGLHLLLVAITSRVAGLQGDPVRAAAIAAATLGGALFLWVAIERLLTTQHVQDESVTPRIRR